MFYVKAVHDASVFDNVGLLYRNQGDGSHIFRFLSCSRTGGTACRMMWLSRNLDTDILAKGFSLQRVRSACGQRFPCWSRCLRTDDNDRGGSSRGNFRLQICLIPMKETRGAFIVADIWFVVACYGRDTISYQITVKVRELAYIADIYFILCCISVSWKCFNAG